jgi:diguanylate cyclase (GGDEF)-like protein
MPKEEIPARTRTRRDLILIGVAVLIVCFAVALDPDRVFEWLAQRRAVQLDEFLVTVVVLGAGFAIFSWRRWTDLSRQVAEYKRLQTQLRDISRNSSLLSETADFLQSCLSSEEAYKIVIRHIQSQFPGSSGAICGISNERDAVKVVAQWGSPTLAEDIFPPEDCWALRRGRVNFSLAPDSKLVCAHIGPNPPTYAMCVPMMAQGETLGILYLDRSESDSAESQLTEPQEQTIKTLAEHLALTLASLNLREKLRMQAIRDPLTDLFNRRYMEESLQREIRRAARKTIPLVVLMVDVDHFKQFNDSFGHEAGDQLLIELAAVFRNNLRAEDIACRFGGEEFTLILTETTLAIGIDRAEKLRQKVTEQQIDYRGQRLPQVTISIGVSCYPENGDSVESLLRSADLALYRAKRDGRNRVVTS